MTTSVTSVAKKSSLENGHLSCNNKQIWKMYHYLQLFKENRAHSQLFFSSAVLAANVITGCCRTCKSNAFFSSATVFNISSMR